MSTILVVDDAQTDRELMARVVNASGHQALLAGDGKQAVALAKQYKPSLIFLDVVMPMQDGYKTCRQLKKDPDTSGIPVVMITSKNADSDRFWSQRQGAVDHVGKPFTPESLLGCIRLYAR